MADNYRTSVKRPCRGIMHVVKRGDTLYKLSRTYNVRVSAIMLANPYMNMYSLQPGDEICIPRTAPIQPGSPGQVVRPEQPGKPAPTVPPVTAVPPIGTAPPQTAVPPIGTAPPQTAVPPIGTVPPVSSVPPGGDAITPVPPIGDLKPRESLEKTDAGRAAPSEQPDTINKYDTIDYEYEKFRASLEPESQTVRSASVEAMREECQSAGILEEEMKEEQPEQITSTGVDESDEVMNEDISAMFENLNNNLEMFNRYMKKMLDKN